MTHVIPDSTSRRPNVSTIDPRGEVTAVVLVLPGGKAHSDEAWSPQQLAALRMRPFASSLHRHGARHGLAVWSAQYRFRGWNGPAADPVSDARWALDEVRRRHGDVPVVLVGHSMGGRAALYAAGDPSVRGVVGLAPWVEVGDSVSGLAGRSLLIAHGSADVITSARASRRFAVQAAAITSPVLWMSVRGDMHAMVVRWGTWHRLATAWTLATLGFEPMPDRLKRAIDAFVS